jgi:hypothetical protein
MESLLYYSRMILTQIWVSKVHETCLLREAAIRVMSAKPSLTAVEILWNGLLETLTAKRRSFKNNMLATVIYAKMNNNMLGTVGDVIRRAQFDSLLDFVDEVVEQKLVQHSKGGVENEQTEQCEGAISSSHSGSGSAEGWLVEQYDRCGALHLFASPLVLC